MTERAPIINVGEKSGEVAPGDYVISRGYTCRVVKVMIHSPGHHPDDSPIREDFYAVEIITDTAGCKRWAGGSHARINGGLRAEWSRD